MTISVPNVTYSEDLHSYHWEQEGISAVLERFQESGDDIRAELTITSEHSVKGGQLYFGRLLLMGPRSRADVRVALEKRDPEPDWGGALEQIVTASLRRYRAGAPAVDLWADDLGPVGRYLVKPFVFDDAVNIIYGSGDSGKSLFSLLLCIAVASGEEVAGLTPERDGPVLYLDWEDSAGTHQERLRALCASLGVSLASGRVIYRRMDASLKESAREVRKDIARVGAALVVVDSLGMACGGDPSDAGGIIQAMLSARSLGVPVLAIHHIGKDSKDKSTPYGSVYASNEARMSWYVESERDGSALAMVLTNYKANRGAHHERQSFRFVFKENDEEAIEFIDVLPQNFAQSKAIGDGGQKWKIAGHLDSVGKAKPNDIASALNMPRASVGVVLSRHKDLFGKNDDGFWFRVTNHVTTDVTPSNSVTRHVTTEGGPLGPRVMPDQTDETREEEPPPIEDDGWLGGANGLPR